MTSSSSSTTTAASASPTAAAEAAGKRSHSHTPSSIPAASTALSEKRNSLAASTSGAPLAFSEGAYTYKLGVTKHAPPQVSLAECRDHLRLLGAFASLRDSVFAAARGASDALPPQYRRYKAGTEDAAAKTKLDPRLDEACQTAWRAYLARASHRFELWLSVVLTPASLGFTPQRASFEEVRLGKGKQQTVPPVTERIPAHCLPPIDVLMMYRE